tara:strand:+ start:965 stop:1222 length:258 start_codon:yes stop_codon:yes gene_type:complete
MANNKQLILITAPFNCGYCKTAKKELPSLCENKGWELIEIEDEKGDSSFPVDTYPTFMVRIDNKMVDTIKGYPGKDKFETTLNKY